MCRRKGVNCKEKKKKNSSMDLEKKEELLSNYAKKYRSMNPQKKRRTSFK